MEDLPNRVACAKLRPRRLVGPRAGLLPYASVSVAGTATNSVAVLSSSVPQIEQTKYPFSTGKSCSSVRICYKRLCLMTFI